MTASRPSSQTTSQTSSVQNPLHSLLEQRFNSYRTRYTEILRSIGKEFILPRGRMIQQKDLYYLTDGQCALCMHGEAGEEITLLYFYPGRLLNFMPCLAQFYPLQYMTRKRLVPLESFVVRAVTDCTFLRIPCNIFLEKYIDSIELHSLIVHSLVSNTSGLFSHACNTPLLPASQRVCRLLLELMDENPPHPLYFMISYAEISSHLSIHTITIAKIFRALREASVIRKGPGMLYITDPDRLRLLAEGKERLQYNARTP